ncbi:Heme A synthase [compost metagenome]
MTASPSGHYLLENKITIHFIHRGMAYLLFALILIYTVKAARIKPSALYNHQKWYPMVLVSLQVLLGIFTVLSSTTIQANRWRLFETIAELHQLVAMFLMLSLVVQMYLVRARPVVAG